jgi:hypothetical protein
MHLRSLMVAAIVAGASVAADPKGIPRGEVGDSSLKIEATLHMDKASIKQALGEEMTPGIVLVAVKLAPTPGKKIAVSRDDFLLRSDRDGQKSTPYSPSQIAGSSVLTVRTGYSGGGIMSEDRGPAWGGLGGGRPQRMPGSATPSVGNGASPEEVVANVDASEGKKSESPLMVALRKKILEEKDIEVPAEGQLYFLMDGKHKVKDLELLYKTSSGRLSIRFK